MRTSVQKEEGRCEIDGLNRPNLIRLDLNLSVFSPKRRQTALADQGKQFRLFHFVERSIGAADQFTFILAVRRERGAADDAMVFHYYIVPKYHIVVHNREIADAHPRPELCL